MKQTTGIEITTRALQFLSTIVKPVPVDNFIRLELTGDPTADVFLTKLTLMMLGQLRSDGMIDSDDLTAPNPKLYGLTSQGVEMHKLFLELTKG